MKRGILLSLLAAVAAVVPVAPAPAAETPYVVYEITRARSGGPSVVNVVLIGDSQGEAGLFGFVELAPRKGGGWTRNQFHIGMYNPTDTTATVYGAGTSTPVPCETAGENICGTAGDEGLYGMAVSFRPKTGNRYLAVVPREAGYVFPLSSHWRLRSSSAGARIVTAPSAVGAGAVGAKTRVEVFGQATAPGGKYGSGVFALAPCEYEGVGSAMLKSDGSDAAKTISCEDGQHDIAFSGTLDGTTWTMTGPVVGQYRFPFRLFVVDYPKR